MELTALLFDVDGTLAETEDIHLQAFNAAFAEFGVEWRWERDLYKELLAFAGGGTRLHHYVAMNHPAFYARPGGKDLVHQIHKRKVQIFVHHITNREIALRPGIKRILEEARREGLRLAIVTSSSPENVAPLLRGTLGDQALNWFEVIATGRCVDACKPAPDIYQWTLKKLGLPAEACLAFEDSANGLRACQGAGIPVVITDTHYTRDEDFTGAVAVLSHLGDTNTPFQVRAGDAHGQTHVDMGLLRQWYSESLGRGITRP